MTKALAALLLTGCLMPRSGQSTQSTPTSSSDDTSASSPAPAPTPASAPSGPQTVSVTIRSSCSKTAKVFYGEKPGFSSGTTSSVSSNSVSSKSFRVGDLMWVLDDSDKPLGNVSVASNTREIEIGSSCTGISAR